MRSYCFYSAEPDRATTLRKSIPLVGSSTFAALPRKDFPHCFTVRHVKESFASRLAEFSNIFDNDDNPSDYYRDTVLCFESKAELDLWQCVISCFVFIFFAMQLVIVFLTLNRFALTDSVSRYCPPFSLQYLVQSRW